MTVDRSLPSAVPSPSNTPHQPPDTDQGLFNAFKNLNPNVDPASNCSTPHPLPDDSDTPDMVETYPLLMGMFSYHFY